MALNKELLGLIVFFVGMVSFLTLFLTTGPTAQLGTVSNLYLNNTQTLNLGLSGNITTGNVQLSGANCNVTQYNQLQSIINFLPKSFLAWLAATNSGCKYTAPSSVASIGTAVSTGFFDISGGSVDLGGQGTIGGLVAQTIGVVAIVAATAIALSVLGNGDAALYVGAAGIGVALIYFMESILTSTVFSGTPGWLMALITGLISAFYLWIVITLLRS